MPTSFFLRDSIKKVEELILSKQHREAYSLCNNLLRQYPEDEILNKLKLTIEKQAKLKNAQVVKSKLEKTKNLIKEGKTEEALKTIKAIKLLAPENKEVKVMENKLKLTYLKEKDKDIATFIQIEQKKLDKLLREDLEQLHQEVIKIENKNHGIPEIQQLTDKYKALIISEKIKRKSELLKSLKFRDIYNFIGQLKKIDEQSPLVKKLEEETKKRNKREFELNKKEYSFVGETHIDTMYKMGNYLKCIQAAKEILSIDPENSNAENYLKKAENALFSQEQDITIDQIVKNQENLKAQYKKDKNYFFNL
ncbi:hypothetical protein KJ632_01635 [Patescibacteria group bacterium]|nr:hypothetical protein [Patescibacteria group bacterium]